MKRQPASSNAFRFAADSIPASATTTRSLIWCRARNCAITGINVFVSALFPSNMATSSGNPLAVTSNPTVIWGSTRRSLLIPTLRSLSSALISKCSVVRSYITNATGPAAVTVAQHAVATWAR